MSFQEMKFRVMSSNLSRVIQTALFKLGYSWYTKGKVIANESAATILTSTYGGITYGNDEYFYAVSGISEYYLHNGELVKEPPKQSEPPIGLRPRILADRERLLEILSAVARYAQSGEKIPAEWQEEMFDLLSVIN